MSTRATVHFKDTPKAKPTAIVYRHGDGYPTGLGADLKAFFKELADHVGDTRFTDSAYLAAKWVVWDAHRMRSAQEQWSGKQRHVLDFLSVGIVNKDPGDTEYRYEVICNSAPPSVVAYARTGDWDNPKWKRFDLDAELAREAEVKQ